MLAAARDAAVMTLAWKSARKPSARRIVLRGGHLAYPQPFPQHGRGHDERVLGQQRVPVGVVDLLQPV